MNNEPKNQAQPTKSNDRSQANPKADPAGKKSQTSRDEARNTDRNQEKR